MNTEEEVLLRVAAEGGSIEIVRLPGQAADRLQCRVTEATEGTWGQRSLGTAETIEEALGIIGDYPWYMLYPVHVAHHIVPAVEAAVRELGGVVALQRWRDRTGDCP